MACWEQELQTVGAGCRALQEGIDAGASHRRVRDGGTVRAGTGGRRLGGSRELLAAGGGEGLGNGDDESSQDPGGSCVVRTWRVESEQGGWAFQLFGPSAVNRPTITSWAIYRRRMALF